MRGSSFRFQRRGGSGAGDHVKGVRMLASRGSPALSGAGAVLITLAGITFAFFRMPEMTGMLNSAGAAVHRKPFSTAVHAWRTCHNLDFEVLYTRPPPCDLASGVVSRGLLAAWDDERFACPAKIRGAPLPRTATRFRGGEDRGVPCNI